MEAFSKKEPKPKIEALRFVKINLEGEDIAYSVSYIVSLMAKTSTLKNSVLLNFVATLYIFNNLS
jgi:hypothetical protein